MRGPRVKKKYYLTRDTAFGGRPHDGPLCDPGPSYVPNLNSIPTPRRERVFGLYYLFLVLHVPADGSKHGFKTKPATNTSQEPRRTSSMLLWQFRS